MNSLADVQLRRIRRCLHSLVTLTQQLQLLIWFYYGVSLQWWSSQFSFVTIILKEDVVQACLLAGLFGAGVRRKLRPQILAICFFGLRSPLPPSLQYTAQLFAKASIKALTFRCFNVTHWLYISCLFLYLQKDQIFYLTCNQTSKSYITGLKGFCNVSIELSQSQADLRSF